MPKKCIFCEKSMGWKSYPLCRDCIDNTFVKECSNCGCGPYAPFEVMRKKSIKRCSACKSTWYCCEKHQRNDYIYHKHICSELSDMQKDAYMEIYNDRSCFVCKRKDKPLMRCSLCHSVRYCSRECQRKDIGNHEKICQIFNSMYINNISTDIK